MNMCENLLIVFPQAFVVLMLVLVFDLGFAFTRHWIGLVDQLVDSDLIVILQTKFFILWFINESGSLELISAKEKLIALFLSDIHPKCVCVCVCIVFIFLFFLKKKHSAS